MAEGAGAAGPRRHVLANPDHFQGKRVGLVLCGGNIDARLLASVMVRELERDDRIVSFRITSNDRPGLLGQRGEPARQSRRQHPRGVRHGRLFLDVPAKGVSIDITIETQEQDNMDSRCSRPLRRRASHRSGSEPRACPRPPSEERPMVNRPYPPTAELPVLRGGCPADRRCHLWLLLGLSDRSGRDRALGRADLHRDLLPGGHHAGPRLGTVLPLPLTALIFIFYNAGHRGRGPGDSGMRYMVCASSTRRPGVAPRRSRPRCMRCSSTWRSRPSCSGPATCWWASARRPGASSANCSPG